MKTDLLIADSDTQLRQDYERLFGEAGIRVVTAADGLECWTRLQQCTPDALVVDMDMLWGGGAGVLARLRDDRDNKLTPAVFITGLDSPVALSKRYGIAVQSCFQKPLQPNDLLASVCAVIDSDFEAAVSGNPA